MSAIGVNATRCSESEFQRSIWSNTNQYPDIHCLTWGDEIGLAFDVEAGLISALAVLAMFLLIFRNLLRNFWRSASRQWQLIQEPVDVYVLGLFIFDFIQAIGGVVNLKWVLIGKVYSSSFCTAQGVIQQFGECGVAMSTLAVTLHTFRVVWWSRGAHDHLIAYIVMLLISLFDICYVTLGPILDKNYMEPSPYWCWLGGTYLTEKITGEYVWMWLTLVVSTVLYLLLFFLYRGNITVDEVTWWKFSVHRRRDKPNQVNGPPRSFAMLAYPIVYSVTVLPLTIARWSTFDLQGSAAYQQSRSLSVGTFFAECVYRFSGFFNVLLFLRTRPELLLFANNRELDSNTGKAPPTDSLDDLNKGERIGETNSIPMSVMVRDADAEAGRAKPAASGGLGALDAPGWDLDTDDIGNTVSGWNGSDVHARHEA